MQFANRVEAGRRLGERLRSEDLTDPVVLGLPRGGVPVAFEVARALGAPLDVIVVRKLGVPTHRELAFGAIGEGGVRVVSGDIISRSGARQADLDAVERGELDALERQARQFRGDRPRVPMTGRTVLVVDDGVATGATALAACQVARAQGAARVVLAVPVAAADAVERLRAAADDVVCLSAPGLFFAVSEWYEDFSQTTDEEVSALLARSERQY